MRAETPEVAGEYCDSYKQALLGAERNLGGVVTMTHVVLRDEAWKVRRVRTGEIVTCASFLEFLTAPPLKGLAEDPKRIEALLKDEPDTLRMFREATTALAGQPKKEERISNNVPNSLGVSLRGNAKAYTLTRLHKARPDLYARVVAGELSAHRAAIEAGLRHQPSPLDQAQRAVAKLSEDEWQALVLWRQQGAA